VNKTQRWVVWGVAMALSAISVLYGIKETGECSDPFGHAKVWIVLFAIPVVLIGAAAFLSAWRKKGEDRR
jgi:hypothetical protein